jgi:hypothetical protein
MVPVTLLTMVDDSTRRVRAFVDESEISTMCLHQRAHVTADAVPGIQMDGIVENIGATVVQDPFARDSSRQFRENVRSRSNGLDFMLIGAASETPQSP